MTALVWYATLLGITATPRLVDDAGQPFVLTPPSVNLNVQAATIAVPVSTPPPATVIAPPAPLPRYYATPLEPLGRPGQETYVYDGIPMNDTLTNSLLLVGGSALLGSIVYHLVKH
jgi:hypothetical protein